MLPSTATVVLLAGPSGSGKSRLATMAGCPRLNLDDFYFDEDHPGLPRTPRTVAVGAPDAVDWDALGSWDSHAALDAILALCTTGGTQVPVYDLAASRRTGSRTLALDGARVYVAEGLFAPDLVAACRVAGVAMEALYLDRPRSQNLVFRFVRDVSEHRKPLPVLVRRGLALWRAEPALRASALAAGCRPVSLREAARVIAGLARRDPVSASRPPSPPTR